MKKVVLLLVMLLCFSVTLIASPVNPELTKNLTGIGEASVVNDITTTNHVQQYNYIGDIEVVTYIPMKSTIPIMISIATISNSWIVVPDVRIETEYINHNVRRYEHPAFIGIC